MNNLQDILLFPVRDADARKQFLFACLIALAGFIIPIIPMLILTGYSARIMRQIIEERKSPSMPDMQTSDWSEMLMDGLRVYGAQLVLMFPVILAFGFGMLSMMSGSIAASVSLSDNGQNIGPFGISAFVLGFALIMLFSLLSLPYNIIISTVSPHVVTTRSFESAFRFKEWWGIFRKGLGQFVSAYLITMVVSWVLMIVMQFAILTIVLICIVPFVMIPYSAYLILVRNALYAQAYLAGSDDLLRAE